VETDISMFSFFAPNADLACVVVPSNDDGTFPFAIAVAPTVALAILAIPLLPQLLPR
jgi:hypothetical protein